MFLELAVAVMLAYPPQLHCSLRMLLTHTEKLIDFTESSTSCFFKVDYSMSEHGELRLTGEHRVIVFQIPKSATPHWLTYTWGTDTGLYQGSNLTASQYTRDTI